MNKMPVIFVGHGSPMNAIEDNEFTKGWVEMASMIEKPKAILAVSAHWFTKGSKVNDLMEPRVIYDMYGFPEELYKINYNAAGSPEFAQKIIDIMGDKVSVDNSWGIDHGTWSVLVKMYPDKDIPVFQLSVDRSSSEEIHYKIGQQLKILREQGVLIFASGNIVHNLSMINFFKSAGYDWSYEFDEYIKNRIINRNHNDIIDYKKAGEAALFSVPTKDHFLPLLYALGATDEEDDIRIFNEKCILGSLSMTSYLFG